MGAISERIQLNIVTVKEFLHINESDTSQDNVIQLLLDAAVNEADLYCNNEFTTDDEEYPIPAAVSLWIMQRVARLFTLRPEGIQSENTSGLNTIQYREVDYSGLSQYRKNPGL